MTLFDASGTSDGTSTASSAASVWVSCALTFQGSGSFTGLAGVGHLASAYFPGASAFTWNYFVDAASVFTGEASGTADGSARVAVKAYARGSSRFLYNTPFIIQGTSSFWIAPVVDRHLPPLKAITLGPKAFRWLQLLQRGDLPVLVCDRHLPIVPYRVTYNLAQLRPDGSRQYVGPRNRVPAAGDAGEFYATGRAGESGQAGQWLIEWTFQRAPDALPEVAEMRFQVVDAVAAGDPRERLPRKIKFGWS
jgi:hypothetical protein